MITSLGWYAFNQETIQLDGQRQLLYLSWTVIGTPFHRPFPYRHGVPLHVSATEDTAQKGDKQSEVIQVKADIAPLLFLCCSSQYGQAQDCQRIKS